MRLSVCVCVSVSEHISETAELIFTKFCMRISHGRGSVLCWRCCDMLCTSGFMITFGSNGPYGDAWMRTATASCVAIAGQSMMSINALFHFSFSQCHMYDVMLNK